MKVVCDTESCPIRPFTNTEMMVKNFHKKFVLHWKNGTFWFLKNLFFKIHEILGEGSKMEYILWPKSSVRISDLFGH